ncbi:MAG TPA: S1 family peptidase [Nannocystaceae bacterium]|nr:S1 family peptidase [Nannocystaceae bacterium]
MRFGSALVLFVGLSPLVAHADPLTSDRDPSAILGGAPVASCGWPSTVWVDHCTATLVDPRMVVLASHCIVLAGTPTTASFGESVEAPARQVPIAGCVTYPNWQPSMPGDGNNDIAICQLAEPVDDVPIVPILMGCEADALAAGATVTLVGFGVHDQLGTMGTKYAADVAVQTVGTDAIFVGDETASSCNGDSGGPAFVQLADGSWRVFGVTSGAAGTTPGCPQTAVYTMIHRYAQWIEDTSMLDVTPCHDADGTWNPDERCTEFPLSPNEVAGTWAMACDDGERSGPSATCGDPIAQGGSSSSSGGESSSSDDGVIADTSTSDAPSESSSGGAEGTTGGETTTGLPPASDDGGDDGGCGCAQQRVGAWWLVLVAITLRGRARARRRHV